MDEIAIGCEKPRLGCGLLHAEDAKIQVNNYPDEFIYIDMNVIAEGLIDKLRLPACMKIANGVDWD